MILVNPKTVLLGVLLLQVYLSEGTEPVNSISFMVKSKPQESKPKVVHIGVDDSVGRAACSFGRDELVSDTEEEDNPDTFLMTEFEQECSRVINLLKKGGTLWVTILCEGYGEDKLKNQVVHLNIGSEKMKYECGRWIRTDYRTGMKYVDTCYAWNQFDCKKLQ